MAYINGKKIFLCEKGYTDKKNIVASLLNREVSEIVNDKVVTEIPSYFQYENANLVRVDLPKVPKLLDRAFTYCTSLKEINFPAVEEMGAAMFANSIIEEAYFPALKTITGWGSNFSNCKKLKRAHFPSLKETLTATFFNGCSSLDTLILGAQQVCTLGNVNAIPTGTPIRAGNGYIYVPKFLIEQYKSDSNWATFVNQFRAIEDYPEVITEGGYDWSYSFLHNTWMYTSHLGVHSGVCPLCGEVHYADGDMYVGSFPCRNVGVSVWFDNQGNLVKVEY